MSVSFTEEMRSYTDLCNFVRERNVNLPVISTEYENSMYYVEITFLGFDARGFSRILREAIDHASHNLILKLEREPWQRLMIRQLLD